MGFFMRLPMETGCLHDSDGISLLFGPDDNNCCVTWCVSSGLDRTCGELEWGGDLPV